MRNLFKIERATLFADSHGSKAIADLKAKFETDCCSEHPNAYWTKEKYFIDLKFRDDMAEVLQKAYAAVMSPSEREKEIAKLLEKGLIEPSKSSWACRVFVVNKHSEQKWGKPRLVVNYKPLNKVL